MRKESLVKLRVYVAEGLEVQESKIEGLYGVITITTEHLGKKFKSKVIIAERLKGYLKQISFELRKGSLIELICWEERKQKISMGKAVEYCEYHLANDSICSYRMLMPSHDNDEQINQFRKIA